MSDSPRIPDSQPSPPAGASGRVLVFIVAYEAERHLGQVLDRIPDDVRDDPEVDFLVIDDASHDATASAATQWASERDGSRMTVLRNPRNLGYGGNQKLGYRYALDHGYGMVVLLHGDGQYAPERLPRFLEIWRKHRPDVILGSRMAEPGGARKGGMPWYKRCANRVLSNIQNRLTGRSLSEYHTGFRAFSTRLLREVAFELNTNDFHFDTEILLQAFSVEAKIVEFAIPTHYGDEICRVPGLAYAIAVLRTTLQWKLHQMGMFCALRYRVPGHLRYDDKSYMAYSSHRIAIGEVERLAPATLLDIGCGPGFVAEHCAQAGATVTGIDRHPPVRPGMAHFFPCDLEHDALPASLWDYDAVLLLDVIEHLAEPEAFLIALRQARPDPDRAQRTAPALILSTPNVAFAGVRMNLLLGRFTYADRGILDITHKRLFTKRSLLEALETCGYDVEKVRAAGVPFAAVVGGPVGRVLNEVCGRLAQVWPSMFGFQFVVTCRPRPTVEQLLAAAERRYVAPVEPPVPTPLVKAS